MKPIEYHSEAKLEAEDAAAYYFDDDQRTSIRFLNILGEIITEIQVAPRRWPFERGTSAQRRPVKGFPYVVFYLNDPNKVTILAIAHTSRRPCYWKKRIAVD